MKAILKVHISVELEGESYDLAWAHAGITNVADRAEAERFLVSLAHNVRSAAEMMSVAPSVGTHVPDLALAKGGDQEPNSNPNVCHNCGGRKLLPLAVDGGALCGSSWHSPSRAEPSMKEIAIRPFTEPPKGEN